MTKVAKLIAGCIPPVKESKVRVVFRLRSFSNQSLCKFYSVLCLPVRLGIPWHTGDIRKTIGLSEILEFLRVIWGTIIGDQSLWHTVFCKMFEFANDFTASHGSQSVKFIETGEVVNSY